MTGSLGGDNPRWHTIELWSINVVTLISRVGATGGAIRLSATLADASISRPNRLHDQIAAGGGRVARVGAQGGRGKSKTRRACVRRALTLLRCRLAALAAASRQGAGCRRSRPAPKCLSVARPLAVLARAPTRRYRSPGIHPSHSLPTTALNCLSSSTRAPCHAAHTSFTITPAPRLHRCSHALLLAIAMSAPTTNTFLFQAEAAHASPVRSS